MKLPGPAGLLWLLAAGGDRPRKGETMAAAGDHAAAGGGERSEFERLRATLAECGWMIAGGVQACNSDEISDSEYDELREVVVRLWLGVLVCVHLPEGGE